MKIALIIPLNKQAHNWSKIVKGIKHQTVKPDVVYAILDRPSDEDISAYKNERTRQDGFSKQPPA